MLNLQSIYFGQRHPNFDYKDMDIVKRIGRLAKKHHKQCENDCNGEGYIQGRFFRCDNPSAYINEDITIFYGEVLRYEVKIDSLLVGYNKNKDNPFKVEYQHDPRGNTVKLYYEDDFIEL